MENSHSASYAAAGVDIVVAGSAVFGAPDPEDMISRLTDI